MDASVAADPPDTAPAAEPATPAPADATPPEDKPPVAVVVPRNASRNPPRSAADPEAANPKKFVTYTVVQGDVMEKIARRHHTTVEAILQANSLKNDSLQIGQKLKIPKK